MIDLNPSRSPPSATHSLRSRRQVGRPGLRHARSGSGRAGGPARFHACPPYDFGRRACPPTRPRQRRRCRCGEWKGASARRQSPGPEKLKKKVNNGETPGKNRRQSAPVRRLGRSTPILRTWRAFSPLHWWKFLPSFEAGSGLSLARRHERRLVGITGPQPTP